LEEAEAAGIEAETGMIAVIGDLLDTRRRGVGNGVLEM